MKSSLSNLLQQAQKMQDQAKQAQAEIADLTVTGESGGGMVRVTLTGRYEARRVEIDPKVIAEDAEMLADLVAAAFNDAVNRLTERMKDKFSGLTQGLDLPPGFKLPF